MTTTSTRSYEALRATYRPERAGVQTRVLLVGESRPANGTFFYRADATLFFRTRDAFVRAFGKRVADGTDFLAQLQRNGYFLIDLCPEPVNHLKGSQMPKRRAMRDASERRLARRLRTLPTDTQIVVAMKGIDANVRRALAATRRPDLVLNPALPFPGRPNHAKEYVGGLARFLRGVQPKGFGEYFV